jgi:hypothetical protein
LECVLVRSDGEAIAINLDLEPVEKPETIRWVDPIHRIIAADRRITRRRDWASTAKRGRQNACMTGVSHSLRSYHRRFDRRAASKTRGRSSIR